MVKTAEKPLKKRHIEKGIEFLSSWVESNRLEQYKEVKKVLCISRNDVIG